MLPSISKLLEDSRQLREYARTRREVLQREMAESRKAVANMVTIFQPIGVQASEIVSTRYYPIIACLNLQTERDRNGTMSRPFLPGCG
jgi:hypothetical protein